MPDPLIQKVDCVHIAVPDIAQGLEFYRDRLGHELLWQTDSSAGLAMSGTDTEIVLDVEPPEPRTDLLVESVEEAVERFSEVGGSIERGPFEIAIGKAAVVRDPWGNRFVFLDQSKGHLQTDANKRVVGTKKQRPETGEN